MKTVSPIASISFLTAVGKINGTSLSPTQKTKLKGHINAAHKRGIKVRYCDLPSWPVSTRDAVWRCLVTAGVDLLSVDDLEAAAGL